MMKTYVVTGRDRSGTSMMMRCISEASELETVRDMEREELIKSRAATEGYDPNPNGYYQSPRNVLPDCVPGQLIKTALYDWPRPIASGEYMVIYMVRDDTERKASLAKAFGGHENSSDMHYTLGESALLARTDCKIFKINYADVIENPEFEFQKLKEVGWPIDVAKAAALVDKNLYRNRF